MLLHLYKLYTHLDLCTLLLCFCLIEISWGKNITTSCDNNLYSNVFISYIYTMPRILRMHKTIIIPNRSNSYLQFKDDAKSIQETEEEIK